MCSAVSVPPVRMTALTSGWLTSLRPSWPPEQGTKLQRLLRHARRARSIWHNSHATRTVSEAGLRITVLPAASAAATPPQGMAIGKFQGETTTTTPLRLRAERRHFLPPAGGVAVKLHEINRLGNFRVGFGQRLAAVGRAPRPSSRRAPREAPARRGRESRSAPRDRQSCASRPGRPRRFPPRDRRRRRSPGDIVPRQRRDATDRDIRAAGPAVRRSPRQPMTSGISAALWPPQRGCQAAMICLAHSPFCGREKSVSGSFSKCCQPRATAAGAAGGNWRFCVRRGAPHSGPRPRTPRGTSARSRCHSGLPTVILKAWRRKFSGPVFSSSRRMR